jgi:hypothetical protein
VQPLVVEAMADATWGIRGVFATTASPTDGATTAATNTADNSSRCLIILQFDDARKAAQAKNHLQYQVAHSTAAVHVDFWDGPGMAWPEPTEHITGGNHLHSPPTIPAATTTTVTMHHDAAATPARHVLGAIGSGAPFATGPAIVPSTAALPPSRPAAPAPPTDRKLPTTIDVPALQAGDEKRTTLMVKNIPNKYTPVRRACWHTVRHRWVSAYRACLFYPPAAAHDCRLAQ